MATDQEKLERIKNILNEVDECIPNNIILDIDRLSQEEITEISIKALRAIKEIIIVMTPKIVK